jgi:hypothetical protein
MKRGLAAILALLAVAGWPAGAAAATPSPLRLSLGPDADRARVRVTTMAANCAAPQTVAIAARWRTRRRGRAALRVPALVRVLRRSPRSQRAVSGRIRFPRVRARAGRARIRAVVVVDWRSATDSSSCTISLPALVGGASDAAVAEQRFRSAVSVSRADPAPYRTTARDHVWTCRSREGRFDCAVAVRLSTATLCCPTDEPT